MGTMLKTAVNRMTPRKQATSVFNSNWLITDWYPTETAV